MLSAHATEVLKNQSIDQSIINQLIKQQTNNPLLKNRPDSEEKGLLMEPQVWEGSAPFCEILSMPPRTPGGAVYYKFWVAKGLGLAAGILAIWLPWLGQLSLRGWGR